MTHLSTFNRCPEQFPTTFPCLKAAGHDGEHGTAAPYVAPRLTDARSAHSFPIWAQEERCRCGTPAAHKVEDVSGPSNFHPMTSYVCCEHFNQLIGYCESYPWDLEGGAK